MNGKAPMTPEEEEQIVHELRHGAGWSALARHLHRCGRTIREIAKKHGVPSKRHIWTADEKEFLALTYAHLRTDEIAHALDRPLSKVYNLAKRMGLQKSEAFLASPEACRLRRGEHVGKAFQFKPGHVPANKGLRRPGYAPGRMRETQFRKGARTGAAQKKWKPIGTICANANGYLRIKVADEPESVAGKGSHSTNWEFVHKRAWEAAHGPIPKGHRLWWKDGDHMNNALENLELLTAKEHMARTTIHNYPPELKQTIRLASSLGRAIRKRTKSDGQE